MTIDLKNIAYIKTERIKMADIKETYSLRLTPDARKMQIEQANQVGLDASSYIETLLRAKDKEIKEVLKNA